MDKLSLSTYAAGDCISIPDPSRTSTMASRIEKKKSSLDSVAPSSLSIVPPSSIWRLPSSNLSGPAHREHTLPLSASLRAKSAVVRRHQAAFLVGLNLMSTLRPKDPSLLAFFRAYDSLLPISGGDVVREAELGMAIEDIVKARPKALAAYLYSVINRLLSLVTTYIGAIFVLPIRAPISNLIAFQISSHPQHSPLPVS